MNPKSHGAPHPPHTHTPPCMRIPPLRLSPLFLRHSWSWGCYGDGMHFSMGWGCQSVDIVLLLPPPAAAFDSHFGLGCSEPPGLSLQEAPSPPSYPAKFHVCPSPQGALFKFTLGQLCSKRGLVDVLPEWGWRWARGLGDGEGAHASAWGRPGVLGKACPSSPLFCISFPRTCSVSAVDCSRVD